VSESETATASYPALALVRAASQLEGERKTGTDRSIERR
jgi:hypothetical protein